MMNEEDYDKGIEFLFDCKKPLPIGAMQDIHKLAIFKLFLKRVKKEIRILMRSNDLLDELTFGMEEAFSNGINIKKLIHPDSKCEFFVIDSYAFWYQDINRNIAFANFNNPKECQKLLKLFKEIEGL